MEYLSEKKSKMSKSNPNKKKLTTLLKRQQTMVDKDVLKGLVDEFVNRIDSLQEYVMKTL